ncbi:hypothetical protein CWI38_1428p0020 [Hamiltosporidium tvaerminnensis]|uniref:Uncharacterized protein n=1 Tax=Hamiltosporidium tvaerminnensis TaxID=1176355 RepID=A0A4Q9LR96_9MICR|nr:hypothetical protein CWI38_1428p0020 [Hamiltosporidium tvaerminnensis]
MLLKSFLILVLGYYNFTIQTTSDQEELLSNDEIDNDNFVSEEYLWNQLTDFSRNCLKNAIEKNNIKSKNFLLSMQTSFDKFNERKEPFKVLSNNQLCFVLFFKVNEDFDTNDFSGLIYEVINTSNRYIKDLLKKNPILAKYANSNQLKNSYELFIKEKRKNSKFYLCIGFKKAIKEIINIDRFNKVKKRFFWKKRNCDLEKSFFVVFSDYLNEYDQITLYKAVKRTSRNYDPKCLNLHIFLKKRKSIIDSLSLLFDKSSHLSYYTRFSVFYFGKMELRYHEHIETSLNKNHESICLLETNLLKNSSINSQKNIYKIFSFDVFDKKDFFDLIITNNLIFKSFFNLKFSIFIEKYKTNNRNKVHKEIIFYIVLGLNDIKKYKFTLKLNLDNEIMKFKVKRYLNGETKSNKIKIEQIAEMGLILKEIAYEYEIMPLNISFFQNN